MSRSDREVPDETSEEKKGVTGPLGPCTALLFEGLRMDNDLSSGIILGQSQSL